MPIGAEQSLGHFLLGDVRKEAERLQSEFLSRISGAPGGIPALDQAITQEMQASILAALAGPTAEAKACGDINFEHDADYREVRKFAFSYFRAEAAEPFLKFSYELSRGMVEGWWPLIKRVAGMLEHNTFGLDICDWCEELIQEMVHQVLPDDDIPA